MEVLTEKEIVLLNKKCEFPNKKWVAVDDVEDILNSRLITIRNMIDILGEVPNLSASILQLREEMEMERTIIKDYLKELSEDGKTN